jgi:hypothetical protein
MKRDIRPANVSLLSRSLSRKPLSRSGTKQAGHLLSLRDVSLVPPKGTDELVSEGHHLPRRLLKKIGCLMDDKGYRATPLRLTADCRALRRGAVVREDAAALRNKGWSAWAFAARARGASPSGRRATPGIRVVAGRMFSQHTSAAASRVAGASAGGRATWGQFPTSLRATMGRYLGARSRPARGSWRPSWLGTRIGP